MVRKASAVAISGFFFVLTGCGISQVETRSYTLRMPSTEEPLIQAILQDEENRMTPWDAADMTNEYGAALKAYEVTPDNVAIVRTTTKGHQKIELELARIAK